MTGSATIAHVKGNAI